MFIRLFIIRLNEFMREREIKVKREGGGEGGGGREGGRATGRP